jgi:hypothetical protein
MPKPKNSLDKDSLKAIADEVLTPNGKKSETLFTPKLATQRLQEYRKNFKSAAPFGSKIYNSPYCAEIVKLILHPAELGWAQIVQILRDTYNFRVAQGTLMAFKKNYLDIEGRKNDGVEWFSVDDIADIRSKAKALADAEAQGKVRLINDTTNIIQYLEKLTLEIEDRIVKLKNQIWHIRTDCQ